MKKKILNEQNYKKSRWSGGNTRELAICPENADYIGRDFIWRLSSADSDQDESSFTKLPDFDRILMVLDGEVVLAHGEERTVNLKSLEMDTFGGQTKTKCFGKLKKDYNLIYRKGSNARMELIEPSGGAMPVELSEHASAAPDGTGGEYASYGIYTIDGYAVVSVNGQTEMVRADEQMVVECEPGERITLSVMGQGKCIFTEVVFEKKISGFEVFETDEIARSGKSDFMIALKLFFTNNRWNALIRRETMKGSFYSRDLEKKLRTLDKFFITAIIWVIGVLLCLFTYTLGVSPVGIFIILVVFTIIDLFIISPLIYLAVLPKPLSAHVKYSGDLNAVEREAFEKQAAYDPHRESLMYKYRERGENDKIGLGDFLGKSKK